MSLKDHPVFFVIAACATTAAGAWAVSEQLRVAPLLKKIEVQASLSKSAPVITDVRLTKTTSGAGQVIEQNIAFTDPEGDAFFASFAVLASDMPDLTVSSASFSVPANVQVGGANYLAKWTCGKTRHFIKFRVTLTDRSGNVSKPFDYTVNCDA